MENVKNLFRRRKSRKPAEKASPAPSTNRPQTDTNEVPDLAAIRAKNTIPSPDNQINPDPPLHSVRHVTSPGWKELRARFANPQRLGIPDLKPCFTEDLLSDIINTDAVKSALPTADLNLQSYILSANQVFAILIQIIDREEQMIRTLKSFQYHGFGNDALPIVDMEKHCGVYSDDDCGLERCSIGNSPCSHDSKLNPFHHYPWEPMLRRQFYDHQWKFNIGFMSLDLEHCRQQFETEQILPVIKTNGSIIQGSGHFSELYQGQMLRKYQMKVEDNEELDDIITKKIENQKDRIVEQEWIKIAIKQLKTRNDHDYVVGEEWIREIQALSKFRNLNHAHIVRGIAACKQNERHYIFLEWANGDNLRKLWSSNPKPTLNPKTTSEFLWQLYGLTDALYHMHQDSEVHEVLSRSSTFSGRRKASMTTQSSSSDRSSLLLGQRSRESSTPVASIDFAYSSVPDKNSLNAPLAKVNDVVPSTSQSIPEITVQEAAENGSILKSSNWRHGDIKPENILVFKDDSSLIGTLKLGDLGRARKHEYSTVSPKRRATGEGYGTREYEPPEASLSTNKARSRTYDIWSMGCIMFEAVYWLLYGIDEKTAIENVTTSETLQGTRYWIPDPDCSRSPKAKVNPVIERAINYILENDPACMTGRKSALRDLLLLVRDHLLVVHLPQTGPGETPTLGTNLKIRTTADEMLRKLTDIVERAGNDAAYLIREADRTSVMAPSLAIDNAERPLVSVDIPRGLQFLGAPEVAPNKLDSYAHDERDIWEFQEDEAFTKSIVTDKNLGLEQLYPQADSKTCDECSRLDFQSHPFKFNYPILGLHQRAKTCELCSLLLETVQHAGVEGSGTADFEYSESTIRLQWGPKPLSLSVCHTSATPMARIRRALPSVATPESPPQFGIMRSWITDCNKHNQPHKCQPPTISQDTCPTRLIEVGPIGSDRVYIVEKMDLSDKLGRGDLQYVALSHPWGDSEHTHFISTKANIAAHKSFGIAVADLPNTFRAAIKTTQQISVDYLWIDSLCILQGDGGDFDDESKKMEDVYSSAYLTITLSSALGTNSRPLGSRPRSVMEGKDAGTDDNGDHVVGQRKVVRLRSKKDQRLIFISESLDNFQADVLTGPLSQRGWVFQERALSRRTIYLTKTQAYWECGEGIRCETLTKLQNPVVKFLGDPNFPNIAAKLNRGGQIYYYESLYEQYSRLKFTFKEDRAVAIYGLESRVCRALADIGGYGVFRNNLGRGLLWRRSDPDPLESVIFSPDSKRGRQTPTWSWMSYVGGIEYISPVGGSVIWNKNVSCILDGKEITLNLKCTVRVYGFPENRGERDARIDMDDATQPHDESLKCIVVGKEKLYHDDKQKKHYVLIVQESSRTKDAAFYERKGVGWMLGRFIGEDEEQACIQ